MGNFSRVLTDTGKNNIKIQDKPSPTQIKLQGETIVPLALGDTWRFALGATTWGGGLFCGLFYSPVAGLCGKEKGRGQRGETPRGAGLEPLGGGVEEGGGVGKPAPSCNRSPRSA